MSSAFGGLRSVCRLLSHAANTLVLLSAVTFGSAWQAEAAPSAGCTAINATWGGGVTLANSEELWNQDRYTAPAPNGLSGMEVSAGETITYSVTTSGSASSDRYSNAGFALYKDLGTPDADDVIVEDYAIQDNELSLSGTHTVAADNTGFIVYAWSGSANGTVQVTVTCTSAPPAPQITGHPSNASVQAGAQATFSVTATDATSYQWQVNDGTGYVGIANGGSYSNATTATLTINPALASMSGYMYRAIATGVGSATSSSATLNVQSAPSLTAVSPATGSVAGGTSVTLTGTDLLGATSVRFGTGSAISVTVNSATSISAVTPSGTAGTVDVAVTTAGGTFTLPGAFTYVVASADASLSNLALSSGSLTPAFASGAYSYDANVTNGTSSIDITPTANEPNATITVDGVAAASGVARSIVLDVGPNSIPVIVTAQDGLSAKTYTIAVKRASAVPTITSVSPASGSTSGGTSVILTGTNFTGTTSVWFDVTPASSYTVNNDNSITATTPAHAAGSVGVGLVASGGSVATSNAFTYIEPTPLAMSPPSGALAQATIGTVYSQTITATGGIGPYTFTVNQLPAGLTLDGNIISGTPTTSGTVSFTVTALDSNHASLQVNYSITVRPAAPVAVAGSATVAANSSSNPITPQVSGGTTDFVTVASGPAHGTASAVGKMIVYTPTAGYSGPDSLTYTATGQGGTSAPATVTINVLSNMNISTPNLPTATVGVAYSHALTASGGSGTYSYSLSSGTLPPGLSIVGSSIVGTPTSPVTVNFTIMATDTYGASASANCTMTVVAPAFSFSPSGGALAEAMSGEDYSAQVTATGGTGALIYNVASGNVPGGLVLNISTGALTGPLDDATEGDYAFSIGVRDQNGETGSANFTLRVKPRAVGVQNQVVDVPSGSDPVDVYLNRGATGGPFTDAEATFVEPANAGTATIIRGQVAQAMPFAAPIGWYLNFKPNPRYRGTVRVGFRLTSALGSNLGTVTYNLGVAQDVAENIDARVRGFVEARQSMIASAIAIPDLMERRRMQAANAPVTAQVSPSNDGLALGFASSLAQLGGSAMPSAGVAASPFNIWIDGTLMAHKRDDNAGDWGSFGMVSLGADYLLSEKALVGLSLHYDRMSDPTDEDVLLTGNGWLAGPYASFEFGKGVFWNTSLLYGGSSNDIDTEFWDGSFNTSRWLFDSSLKGQMRLDDITMLTPRLRAVYFSEEVDDYAVRNDLGDEIEIDGFNQEQLRLSLGAEITRTFELANGSTLMPKLGVTAGYSAIDGSGLFGTVTTGLSLQTVNDWTIDAGLLLNIENEGGKTVGAKLGVSNRF